MSDVYDKLAATVTEEELRSYATLALYTGTDDPTNSSNEEGT